LVAKERKRKKKSPLVLKKLYKGSLWKNKLSLGHILGSKTRKVGFLKLIKTNPAKIYKSEKRF